MSSSDSRIEITPELYEHLVMYFKYAASAYSVLCPRPNGNHLVTHQFTNSTYDIEGFVARDSSREEIVVAIRGRCKYCSSASGLAWCLCAVQVLTILIVLLGLHMSVNVLVHSGFLLAWNSIVVQVLAVITEQLLLHPGYNLVTTGHSLGGSLATLAAVTLKSNFPGSQTMTYSYGAPRTGNNHFAHFFNEMFGKRAFRVVHTYDGVPTMIPMDLGYHHHGAVSSTSLFLFLFVTGVEYWQHTDPASHKTTRRCSKDGEDPKCSMSIPSQGLNIAHLTYFGILATTPFCW
ncbi:alpha/beta-hydrolase [Mycena floridula]|nr:alpha/beta-hydrolase [Mycena floridula]